MRVLSHVLIVSGVGLLVWTAVVWRFGDPVTALWYRFEQQRLESAYRHRAARFDALVPAPQWLRPMPAATSEAARGADVAPTWRAIRPRLAAAAAAYARSLGEGGPVGIIVVPRLGLTTMIVDGTSSADLRKGPGLDRRSTLPGLGGLTYIAGHRTTFGAPFAAIDTMRPGDPIEVRLPYASFRYVVSGHRIVAAGDVSVLRAGGREVLVLQACHPRFFATNRYLVDARLVTVTVRGQGSVTVPHAPAAAPDRGLAVSGRRSPSRASSPSSGR